MKNRSYLNSDMITWECDYPHSDSSWPNGPESVAQYLEAATSDAVDRITHLNAIRIYQFDPFRHTSKEEATVGALRAKAADVDMTLRSSERLRERITTDEIVTIQSGLRIR